MAVDADGQLEGIGLVSQGERGAHGGRQGLAAVVGHNPVQRGLRLVVAADEAACDAQFLFEFHTGLIEIHHGAPVAAVQLVDRVKLPVRVVAFPAQELAHMGPVLLFDVGIVVLL